MADVQLLSPHLGKVRKPQHTDKVYKDECVFSHDTPETDTGLYICLNTFLGFGRDYVEHYHRKTGNSVFLHIGRKKIPIPADKQGDGPEKKITRLAIGVEGGFDPDANKRKFEVEDTFSVVVLPSFASFPWPDEKLPEAVKLSVAGVLEAESATKLAELEAMAGTWDGEARIISKHAKGLTQLDNGKKIPPSGWKCEKCDLTTNLWLNLTDGSILCGRKFFDGSGGNDHAVEHYANTRLPLAVKLGTITNDGKADVFSYDEDDMVEDPWLGEHLAHWGINVARMEKTEKCMAELELELNQKQGEWFSLQESGSALVPVYGPGLTGLANLGNSCYLNSVMQVLFAVPDFQKRFTSNAAAEIFQASSADPASDFNVQMAKLGVGLTSGKYSVPSKAGDSETEQSGISPLMFKTLIGKGHPDFSTKKQQDAQEFFLHVLNVLERNSRHAVDPAACFKFRVEDRLECSVSHAVKYSERIEACLPLSIPLEAAVNADEVAAHQLAKEEAEKAGTKLDSTVRPRIPLQACLDAFAQVETVDQFYSTAIEATTTAYKTTRLSTFPDYLLLHLKKFTVLSDWTPAKLDVAVEMPDTLDLSGLRGTGPQPNETLLVDAGHQAPQPVIDQQVVQQLAEMGFPEEACKKAVFFTENRGLEPASEWLMSHIADSDLSDPFVPPGLEAASSFVADPEALGAIESMGFTRAQAEKALRATANNVERAADWIFTHAAELDEADDAPASSNAAPQCRDGSEKYRLVAFISHMGTSTTVGHYVCHILRDDRWVIYNDNKVALSENPPKELGYLYLYERIAH